MRTLGSLAAFVVAILSFSRLWQGVRAALEGARLYSSGEALMWMGVFLVAMGYLAFVIYAADRAAGRTKRSLRLFDRLLERGRAPSKGASDGL